MFLGGCLISSKDRTIFDGCWGIAGGLLYYRMLGAPKLDETQQPTSHRIAETLHQCTGPIRHRKLTNNTLHCAQFRPQLTLMAIHRLCDADAKLVKATLL